MEDIVFLPFAVCIAFVIVIMMAFKRKKKGYKIWQIVVAALSPIIFVYFLTIGILVMVGQGITKQETERLEKKKDLLPQIQNELALYKDEQNAASYTNPNLKFKIKYPKQWLIKEGKYDPASHGQFISLEPPEYVQEVSSVGIYIGGDSCQTEHDFEEFINREIKYSEIGNNKIDKIEEASFAGQKAILVYINGRDINTYIQKPEPGCILSISYHVDPIIDYSLVYKSVLESLQFE